MKRSSFTVDELYKLLPAYIRQKDAQNGGQFLYFILKVMAEQIKKIENNIEDLYDNWFIETCEDWIIPYIGDLVGIKGYSSNSENTRFYQRALIANTIKYNQSKGAAFILENLTKDITGWNAIMIEFFKLLNITKNIKHIDSQNTSTTVDFKDLKILDAINTPFDTTSHIVDFRDANNTNSYHNLKNVGIFVWRLKSFHIVNAPAFSLGKGKYSFSQMGHDIQLFNNGNTYKNFFNNKETSKNDSFTPFNIKQITLDKVVDNLFIGQRILITGYLQNNPTEKKSEFAIIESIDLDDDKYHTKISLKDNLMNDYDINSIKINTSFEEQYTIEDSKYDIYQELKVNSPISLITLKKFLEYFYAKDGSKSIQILVDDVPKNIEDIVVHDLSLWDLPSWKRPTLGYNQIAIDPVNGRILFAEGVEHRKVSVSYYYGFSKNIGGGLYNRPSIDHYINKNYINTLQDKTINQNENYSIYFISKSNISNDKTNSIASIADNYYRSLLDAINQWNADGKRNSYFIITDNEIYYENVVFDLNPHINIIIAAHPQNRPVIKGNISIIASDGGKIVLDGLIIDSYNGLAEKNQVLPESLFIKYKKNSLDSLIISHCTIVPRKNKSIEIDIGNDHLEIIIDSSICGSISTYNSKARLKIKNSIIDGKNKSNENNQEETKGDKAIDCYRISDITNSTIFGKVDASIIDLAGNSIFTDKIKIKRVQTGCIRFCYIPEGSNVPHMYKCRQEKPEMQNNKDINDKNNKNKKRIVKPIFTSQNYGHHGYAQLDSNNDIEILEGADNKSEMGVFNSLFNIQKEKVLKAILNDYNRVGVNIGVFVAK